MKKKIFLIVLTVSLLFNVFTIIHFLSFNHKRSRIPEIKKVTVVPENIVFLGDSITYFWNLNQYFPNNHVVNSGINGNVTTDILNDMENRVYRYNPSKVFILIGTNDIPKNKSSKEIVDNIFKIVEEINKNRPDAKVYVESIYPINNTNNSKIDHNMVNIRTNTKIKQINSMIESTAKEKNITYIDIYDKLVDKNGNLNINYTRDGLHMSADGYKVIANEIKDFLN